MKRFYQMCVALVLGIQAATTVNAQNRISLQEVPFCTYSGWGMDAQKTGDAECAWVVGEATGQPYGDGSVINRADLSQYSKLIIVATAGTPRIMMNRDSHCISRWRFRRFFSVMRPHFT